HGREDVRGAAAWLETHVPREQPLLVTSSEMAYLARYHWADRRIVEYPAPRAVVTATSADDVAQRLPWGDGRAVYVFGRAWVSDPEGALENDLRRRFASCGRFQTRRSRINCLRQTAHAAAQARPCEHVCGGRLVPLCALHAGAARRAARQSGGPRRPRALGSPGLPGLGLLPGGGIPRRPKPLRPGRAGTAVSGRPGVSTVP